MAALLLLVYLATQAGAAAKKGYVKGKNKIKTIYQEELKQMEGYSGKYPAKFFDSVGKGLFEKIGEYQAPKEAKHYRDAQNYRWAIKPAPERITDAIHKFTDGLAKLFGK